MILKNEQGECPFCSSTDLDYGAIEFEDDMLYYPWTCNNCKREGEEWYSLKFSGHNIITKDNDNIEVEEINNGHCKSEV